MASPYLVTCIVYGMVIVQPYGLIHWKVVLYMWYRPENRSDIGLRLYHIRLSSLTIFIATVTVSAAEDMQASGKRQRLSLKQKSSKQSIARCTGYQHNQLKRCLPGTDHCACRCCLKHFRQGRCAEPDHRLLRVSCVT